MSFLHSSEELKKLRRVISRKKSDEEVVKIATWIVKDDLSRERKFTGRRSLQF